MISECPCYLCPKKGCGEYHGSCEKYLQWRKEVDAERKARQRYRARTDCMKYKYDRTRY